MELNFEELFPTVPVIKAENITATCSSARAKFYHYYYDDDDDAVQKISNSLIVLV